MIKPNKSNLGRGVSIGLRDAEEVTEACGIGYDMRTKTRDRRERERRPREEPVREAGVGEAVSPDPRRRKEDPK